MADKVVPIGGGKTAHKEKVKAAILAMLDEARAEVEQGDVTDFVLAMTGPRQAHTSLMVTSRETCSGLGFKLATKALTAEIEEL